MGKFDRKVSKNEPEAPSSMKIVKKKSNADLARFEKDHKEEKNRSMKILQWMQRADEIKHGGATNKANAHLDIDKMVKNQIRKEEKKRRKINTN